MQDNQSNSNFPNNNGVNNNIQNQGVNTPPNAGGGSFGGASPQGGVQNPATNVGGVGGVSNQTGVNQPTGQPGINNQPQGVNGANTNFNPAQNPVGVNPAVNQPGQTVPNNQVNNMGQNPNPMGQVPNQQNQNQENNQGGDKKDSVLKAKRKRKTAISLLVTFIIAAVAGVFAAVNLLTNKSFLVHYVTGPFAAMESTSVQNGTMFDVPQALENKTNGDGDLLVKFTGWYDKDGNKFTGAKITSDITLYAGYETFPVKQVFVSANHYSDLGYVYLTSISPKYYDGKVDFSSQDLKNAILNLDTDIYEDTTDDFVVSYDKDTNKQGTTSIQTTFYANYMRSYFDIEGFALEPNGTFIYDLDDVIETPDEEAIYYVIFRPKNITITLNNNLEGLKTYYQNLGYGEEALKNYENEEKEINRVFKTDYEIVKYSEYSSIFTKPNPTFHKFLGWSSLAPYDKDGKANPNFG
ncbi:MAG: hypothetical protein IKA31_04245, partial [Clostridia bacterium]|nr:hypothetical protein [Clostridia bacterium]